MQRNRCLDQPYRTWIGTCLRSTGYEEPQNPSSLDCAVSLEVPFNIAYSRTQSKLLRTSAILPCDSEDRRARDLLDLPGLESHTA